MFKRIMANSLGFVGSLTHSSSYLSDLIQGHLISRLTDLCAGGDIETLGAASMTNALFLGLGCIDSKVFVLGYSTRS